MLRQIVGAALGSRIAKQTPALGGATGAALGAAIPFVISRMSIPAMLIMGAGGYVAKRYLDQKTAEDQAEKLTRTKVSNPGVAPKSKTGSVIDPPPGGAA